MKNKIKKILGYLKKRKALTLVEVLVSIVLTYIVMLHGTMFFVATWQLNDESKDYNTILNDVASNIEKCVSMATSNITDGKAPYSEYVIQSRKLRNKYDVSYTIKKTNIVAGGFFYIESSAVWNYNDDDDAKKVIKMKTYYNSNKWNG